MPILRCTRNATSFIFRSIILSCGTFFSPPGIVNNYGRIVCSAFWPVTFTCVAFVAPMESPQSAAEQYWMLATFCIVDLQFDIKWLAGWCIGSYFSCSINSKATERMVAIVQPPAMMYRSESTPRMIPVSIESIQDGRKPGSMKTCRSQALFKTRYGPLFEQYVCRLPCVEACYTMHDAADVGGSHSLWGLA